MTGQELAGDDRPIRGEEVLDQIRVNQIRNPERIEGGAGGDPPAVADGKFRNANPAGVLHAVARIRLGEKAGERVVKAVIRGGGDGI